MTFGNRIFSCCALGLTLSALSTTAGAQESQTETQAIRCSAAYFVMTAISEVNPPLGDYFTQMVEVMALVYAKERQKRSIQVVNRDVSTRREVILKEFASTYSRNPQAVHKETMLCLTWTEAVRVKGGMYDQYPATPWPANPIPKITNAWSEMVPAVFGAWHETGAVTPGDLRKDIERSLSEKLKR
jgi:hypothetical protein